MRSDSSSITWSITSSVWTDRYDAYNNWLDNDYCHYPHEKLSAPSETLIREPSDQYWIEIPSEPQGHLSCFEFIYCIFKGWF